MQSAALPKNETDRLQALKDLQILDSAAEQEFDALVKAAALACGVPISLISLIDTNRQWFKARVGLDATQTHRDLAFCAHAIHGDGVFEVPNALEDARFADNPLVTGDPNIRFYAGATLKLSNGANVGTLCVIDRQPRQLSDTQREILANLACAAVKGMEGRLAARALVESDARFRSLTEASPLGVYATDAHGNCTYTNTRWQEIYGLSLKASLGLGWTSSLHPQDKAAVYAQWQAAAQGGAEFNMEFRVRLADGAVRHVHSIARTVHPLGNVSAGFVGTVEDITERKHQQDMLRNMADALAEQNELLSVTLMSIGDSVVTTDAKGCVTWLNPVAERMTGWLNNEAIGLPLGRIFRILHNSTRQPAACPVEACLRTGEKVNAANHTLLISRSGEEFGIEESAAPIRKKSGEVIGAVLVFRDVTEQRRLTGEMSYRSTHDELTGLVNRSEFEKRLARLLQKSQTDDSTHALLYIDLDQFKLVNDACGHTAGDQLLQQVSKIMAEGVRSRDTLARLGGDEFGILLDHCTAEQAQRVAQQICDRMEEFRFLHDERRFRIGASIGLVAVTRKFANTAAVLQAADTSCYAAKEAGRNRVHTWFDTDEAMRERHGEMQWTARIEHALDENRFVLFAQRIHAMQGGEHPIYAEVLIRMLDTDGTLIPPGAFLPAAERFHLASRIDRWVLREATQWLAALPDITRIETLCINLSGHSIGDKAFHRQALQTLSELGREICERVCLEITETAAVTNLADAAQFIDKARALGVRIALDDFGAGASSFGYLKSLKVDLIKIDGQFIKDLIEDPLDDAAVRSFVDVARVVGVKTVAEYVDRAEVLDRVREMGVTYGQGFHLHKPRPLLELLGNGLLAR
jgi:diguanylate cyclase